MFQAFTPAFGTKVDNTITGYTITHGANGDPTGLSSTTAEIGMAGAVTAVQNIAALTIGLTDYGSTLLASIIGPDPAEATPARGRFYGRVVGTDVNDGGDNRPGQLQTSITASTYTSLIGDLNKPVTLTAPFPYVQDLYAAMLAGAKLPGANTLTTAGGLPRTRWTTGTVDASAITGECMADIGVMLRMPRGKLTYNAWDTDSRFLAAAILATSSSNARLLRRQCQAPVTWSIPVTIPHGVGWSYYTPSGDHVSGLELPDGTGTAQWPRVETVNLDDLVIDAAVTNIGRIMRARARRTSPTRYSLNTLHVDLLRLLSSGDADDAATAGMLLRLDAGDPLELGYDWPDEISGIVFASRIVERVTRDAWTLDIDIHTFEQVTGEESPPVSGGTWDNTYPQHTAWDDIPETTTWDGA